MAKNLTVTWLGDSDPSMQAIVEGGIAFVKGQPVKVPADHAFNGLPWADKLKGNPTFAVDEEADPVDAGEEDERDAIKQTLADKGVKFRENASLESLRKMLADNEPAA